MPMQKYFGAVLPPKEYFEPQFCPNPKCENYGKPPLKTKWCQRIGFFKRKNGDEVPRWLCLQGERKHSFSYAGFECTYWLKRRDLLPKIAQQLGEQSCLRGLARSLEVSQNCIYRQAMRIGRHCLVLQQMALNSIDPQRLTTLIFDELESWEVSQFVPTTHPLFMDEDSGFKLALICAPINRKGRMTKRQFVKQQQWISKYGKSPGNSSKKTVGRILDHLKPLYAAKNKVEIATDEKKTYVTELRKQWKQIKFKHERYNSRINREVGSMGKINQEDQYLRQRCSTMRRETLDFMRRHNNTSLRHAIYLIKRNFVMANAGSRRKRNPAVYLKLIAEPVSWARVFSRRVVDGLRLLPGYLQEIYLQKSCTPYFKNNHVHSAVYAI